MSKIDWKHLSTTEGYISLKKAYIADVQEARRRQNPMRDKTEFYREFRAIICKAQAQAEYENRPIHEVLTEWESTRRQWWFGCYNGTTRFQKPRVVSSLKPHTIKGFRKRLKEWSHNSPQETKNRVCEEIQRTHKTASTKLKPRWTMAKKKAAIKFKSYR